MAQKRWHARSPFGEPTLARRAWCVAATLFFEHTCRDEGDWKRCLDDLHVNPLKHGLVDRVRDWPWSSFHRNVSAGEYPVDWGGANQWYGDEFQYFE